MEGNQALEAENFMLNCSNTHCCHHHLNKFCASETLRRLKTLKNNEVDLKVTFVGLHISSTFLPDCVEKQHALHHCIGES